MSGQDPSAITLSASEMGLQRGGNFGETAHHRQTSHPEIAESVDDPQGEFWEHISVYLNLTRQRC